MLQGLDYVPVHRNLGIDAILRDGLDGTPITIRVQRHHETVFEAARKLFRASTSKKAKIMFLVVIGKGGDFEFAEVLPPGVIAIESPAIRIREYLLSLQKTRSIHPDRELANPVKQKAETNGQSALLPGSQPAPGQ